MQEQIDLSKLQKFYCDNVNIVSSDGVFYLVVRVGEEMTTYVFSAEHMKRLSQALVHNVGEFEKKVRKIDAEWPPAIQSPIQATDLKDSGSSGKGKKSK